MFAAPLPWDNSLADGETRVFHLYESWLKRAIPKYIFSIQARKAVNYFGGGIPVEIIDWRIIEFPYSNGA